MPDLDLGVLSPAMRPKRKPAVDLAVVTDPIPMRLLLYTSARGTLIEHPANGLEPDSAEGRHAYAAKAGSRSSSLKAVVKSA